MKRSLKKIAVFFWGGAIIATPTSSFDNHLKTRIYLKEIVFS